MKIGFIIFTLISFSTLLSHARHEGRRYDYMINSGSMLNQSNCTNANSFFYYSRDKDQYQRTNCQTQKKVKMVSVRTCELKDNGEGVFIQKCKKTMVPADSQQAKQNVIAEKKTPTRSIASYKSALGTKVYKAKKAAYKTKAQIKASSKLNGKRRSYSKAIQ